MNPDDNIMYLLITLAFVLAIVIWFLPVICSRGNENTKKILWITIFIGWIPIVWIALLISALLGTKKV